MDSESSLGWLGLLEWLMPLEVVNVGLCSSQLTASILNGSNEIWAIQLNRFSIKHLGKRWVLLFERDQESQELAHRVVEIETVVDAKKAAICMDTFAHKLTLSHAEYVGILGRLAVRLAAALLTPTHRGRFGLKRSCFLNPSLWKGGSKATWDLDVLSTEPIKTRDLFLKAQKFLLPEVATDLYCLYVLFDGQELQAGAACDPFFGRISFYNVVVPMFWQPFYKLHIWRDEYSTPPRPVLTGVICDARSEIQAWIDTRTGRVSTEYFRHGTVSMSPRGASFADYFVEYCDRVIAGEYQNLSLFPRSERLGVVRTVTNGIECEVVSVFSTFIQHVRWIYSFRLRILNSSDEGYQTPEQRGFKSCRLLTRHWRINFEGHPHEHRVDGDGVVGFYPIFMESNEKSYHYPATSKGDTLISQFRPGPFVYESGVGEPAMPLTQRGTMGGYLMFCDCEDPKNMFRVDVPTFHLKPMDDNEYLFT